ncbi:hypothetical protein Axi01nite_52100 [Actinoplanes xinjiangensis]|nr:hypothetical protein Axi01nite_52100 [Actinoplanes xinjiangensis]
MLGSTDGVVEPPADGSADGFDEDDEDEDGGVAEVGVGTGGGGAGGTVRLGRDSPVATGDGFTDVAEVAGVSGVYVYVISGSSSSGSSPAPAPPKSMSTPGNCSPTGAGR